MTFFLTPSFAPAYQQCGPFACAPRRSRPVSRPSAPSFIPFLSQIEGLISEIDREARVQAAQEQQQRQQRKRAFHARFDVKETNEGYEVEGEVPGFEQENISIEVTDEHTLKISGNTEQRNEQPAYEPQATESENVALNQAEDETSRAASPTGNDTESHKSYQPTVEDDFEDLGAETSSNSSTAAPTEPKGKEKAVEETSIQKQAQSEAPAQQQTPQHRHWLSERVHGSFERSFQFPERINMENVRAGLKNGVLSISVPKAPAFSTRQITIQ